MHTVCLLNNQPFGTEIYALPDGRMVATFYEEGGFPMQRKANSQLSINAIDNRKQNESALLTNMAVKQR